jgi:subtilisin family serine protease
VALASASSKTPSYVISFSGHASDLKASVERAGGQLTRVWEKAGLAGATSEAADFSSRVKGTAGVQSVARDVEVQWLDPRERVQELAAGGIDERFFPIQWAPKAISAPEAWAAGYFGAGARVAILDGGIYNAHVDIAPNLDVARSTSFATGAYNTDLGTFWHGTHVAGIVAAADNELGVIGIAPKATLIGVKVLHGGSGSFESVISGIIYAATPIIEGGAGAHIINMSLGATFPKVEKGFTSDNSDLLNSLSKATSYARGRGVLVVTSAGNGDPVTGIGIDFDHTGSLVTVPAQSVGVITVAALGPERFAYGATNFDDLASYSNYGQSLISLSGPGGDSRYPGNENCTMTILTGPITTACWVFDMVISSARGTVAAGGFSWAAGTSMAAPAVSGVAALIVGKYGPMQPAQLEAMLRRSSDDLGKPGNDDAHGAGRVNALRAVQ